MKKYIFKSIILVIAFVFLATSVSWSAPDLCKFNKGKLRSLSFSEQIEYPVDGAALLDELYHANAHDRDIIAAHGITPERIAHERALINAARQRQTAQQTSAAAAHLDLTSPFPHSISATSSPQDAQTREQLIAAGQNRDALANLGIIIGAAGEGGRLLAELVRLKILTEAEAEQLVKPTVPISAIAKYSPLAIQLKTISYICRKFKINIPVCVAMSPLEANEPILERFLRENNNFGIVNLITVVQGVNVTYDPQTGKIATKADGTPILKPNGIAGIFDALRASGRLGWFRQCFRDNRATDGRLLYLNGDNVVDPELFFIIAGAAAQNANRPFIGFTYVAAPNSPYGRFCNIVRDGQRRCEIVETSEVDTIAGLRETCDAAGVIAGNVNTMLMRLDDQMEARIDRVVAKEHALTNKTAFGKGVVKADELGEKKVDHLEAWVTDFAGEFLPEEVATVNVDDTYRGIKNNDVRTQIYNQYVLYGRRLLERLAQRLGVAITIDDGAVIEFDPGIDLDTIHIGNNCVVRSGARLFIGSENITIGDNVEFADGTIAIRAQQDGQPVTVSGNLRGLEGMLGILDALQVALGQV